MGRKPRVRARPDARRWILDGEREPIFSALPQTVLANLRPSRSEGALVWNVFYPLNVPRLCLSEMLALPPLWGTPASDSSASPFEMFFWGYAIDGSPMPGLQEALLDVDGEAAQTEVDLFLSGGSTLIAVEAKRGASPGRCKRYQWGRCPEVHPAPGRGPCRYWEHGPQFFGNLLDAGVRPGPDSSAPACSVHYQLFRTLLVGAQLAKRHERGFGMWLIVPKARWPSLEPEWLDFAERVRPDELWRRLRVIAWEDVLTLGRARKSRQTSLGASP